jgi:hypothetical protein
MSLSLYSCMNLSVFHCISPDDLHVLNELFSLCCDSKHFTKTKAFWVYFVFLIVWVDMLCLLLYLCDYYVL